MSNYHNGKIYKIIDNTNGDIYIGSTIQSLSNRLSGHKKAYKSYLNGKIKTYIKSFDIIKNNDYKIVLIENYSCNNKEELIMREQYYIDNTNCINKNRAYISKEQLQEYQKEQKKQYYIDNTDCIIKRNKQYYINNKEKRKEYDKQYRIDNKEYHKEYRQYRYSWGGDVRYNNNLLSIDVNLFY